MFVRARTTAALAAFALAACSGLPGQGIKKSQHGTVTQTIGATTVAIVYNRPVARGREIYGGIVSYDKVWNPGADQATSIAFSRGVKLAGHELPAGKYSIWAIPRPDRWTLIFSRAANVFHEPYPGEDKDALRLEVVPTRGPHMETLTFHFPVVDGTEGVLALHWAETILEIPISTEG